MFAETKSQLSGKVLSVLAGGKFIQNYRPLVGEIVTSTLKSDYPTQYNLSLYNINTSQSSLEFQKVDDQSSAKLEEGNFIAETEKSIFHIQVCYGIKCTLADSREVAKKSDPSEGSNIKEIIFGLAGAVIFLLVVLYMVVLGQEKNIQETEELLAGVIKKDATDSQQIQKEKLRKEIELQNQSDLSLSEIKMMDDSLGFSAGGAKSYETLKAELELDASHDSAGF